MRFHVDDVIDGKYRVKRVLGHGGVGAVYEAENLHIRRRVAIKVLHARVAKHSGSAKRFRREAQAAARVGSDRIVEVLDFGQLAEGENYLVMEYLEGESLAERLRERGGHMSAEELVPIIADLLEGLEDAHYAGIVHRDLKPDNIFLVQPRRGHGDFVKILDFGISKFTFAAEEQTVTGVLMGTPYFMAPEQGRGARELDSRADIYSVGAIIFRCLTGRHHFTADALGDLLQLLLTKDAPRLSEIIPEADPELTDLVARALSRDPDERPVDAAAMRAELHNWLEDRGLPLAAGSRDDLRVTTMGGTGSSPQLASTSAPHVPLLATPPEPPPDPETVELPKPTPTLPLGTAPPPQTTGPGGVWPIVVASALGLVIVSGFAWWLTDGEAKEDTTEDLPSALKKKPSEPPSPSAAASNPQPSTTQSAAEPPPDAPAASAAPSTEPDASTAPSAPSASASAEPLPRSPRVPRPPRPTPKRRTFRRKLQ